MKFEALLSVFCLSEGFPLSSNVLSTSGTGNIAGTVHALIFQSVNCSEIITCDPQSFHSKLLKLQQVCDAIHYKAGQPRFLYLPDTRHYTMV